jgi:hypothetical protein
VTGAAGTSQIMEPVKLVGVLLMMSMEPNLVVDIGGFIDTKLEGLRCHTSHLGERLDDDDVGFVDGRAEFSVAKEPFHYSEAFWAFRFDLPGEPVRGGVAVRQGLRPAVSR